MLRFIAKRSGSGLRMPLSPRGPRPSFEMGCPLFAFAAGQR